MSSIPHNEGAGRGSRRAPLRWADVVLASLAVVLLVGSVAWDVAYLPHDRSLGLDFTTFYAAGLVVRHGGDPYNLAQLHHVEFHLHSIGDPRYLFTADPPYSNPPLFAWAMAGLAQLPIRAAYLLWTIIMAGCLCAGVTLAALAHGARRPAVALLCAISPITAITLFLGQQTPLLLLSLAGSLTLLRRERPTAAGIVLTIGWIKPQLFLPMALLIVALSERRVALRVLAGLLAGTALIGAASWLLAGGSSFAGWLGDLTRMTHGMETTEPTISSLAGLYRSVLGQPWIHILAVLLPVLWLCGVAVLARWARRQGLAPTDPAWLSALCVLLAAWLLATPYTHPQDLVLLLVAWPVLVGMAMQRLRDQWVRLALCALLVAPEADLLGFRPNLTFCYSMLVPLTILVALARTLASQSSTDTRVSLCSDRGVAWDAASQDRIA